MTPTPVHWAGFFMKGQTMATPKPRDPAAHLRSAGALRQRTIPDRKKALPRKAKHRGARHDQ
jgi:hypothetical protein